MKEKTEGMPDAPGGGEGRNEMIESDMSEKHKADCGVNVAG